MASMTPKIVSCNARNSYETSFTNIKEQYPSLLDQSYSALRELGSKRVEWIYQSEVYTAYPSQLSALTPEAKSEAHGHIDRFIKTIETTNEAAFHFLNEIKNTIDFLRRDTGKQDQDRIKWATDLTEKQERFGVLCDNMKNQLTKVKSAATHLQYLLKPTPSLLETVTSFFTVGAPTPATELQNIAAQVDAANAQTPLFPLKEKSEAVGENLLEGVASLFDENAAKATWAGIVKLKTI